MSMKGLEPSRIAPLEPKPSAYTNSATSTESPRLDLNQRPTVYKTVALPLSYKGTNHKEDILDFPDPIRKNMDDILP